MRTGNQEPIMHRVGAGLKELKMREIKFRAWNGKVMTNDFYIEPDGTVFLDSYETYESQSSVIGFDDFVVYPKDYKLMQFTGILDKNGKEIYEGDILQSEHSHMECHGKCKITVCWDESKNGWNFRPTVIDIYDMDVIGNIYESPELLE